MKSLRTLISPNNLPISGTGESLSLAALLNVNSMTFKRKRVRYFIEDLASDQSFSKTLKWWSSSCISYAYFKIVFENVADASQYPVELAVHAGMASAAIYYSVDKAMKRYLAYLDEAIISEKDKKFSQFELSLAVKRTGTEVNLNEDGCCFGHTLMWYQINLTGLDYADLIARTSRSLLYQRSIMDWQLQLLQGVAFVQETSKNWAYDNSSALFVLNSRLSCFYLVSHMLDQVILNPDILYAIFLLECHEQTKSVGRKAHIIGITATRNNKIHYLDSNFCQRTFTDVEVAKASLTRHLSSGYKKSIFNSCIGYKMTLFYADQRAKTDLEELTLAKRHD